MAVKRGNETGGSNLKREDVLQAVVTADNFSEKFAPLTQELPWVLLPLINRPLIEYTLEYLSNAGIQEVFIFCCSHADRIREHIRNSRWSSATSTLMVNVISSEAYLSVGDMIRDLDCKGLIRSNFALLDGGVISTIPLRPIFEEHRKTIMRDKGALMTVVYRKASPKHKTRCLEDECTVALEPNTKKLLYHQKMAAAKRCDFPLEVFQQHSRVAIRHDLLNTHIAICSPHVPPIFSDNFDYQTREDFVKGILEHEEIMGNSIYLHVSDSHYAASVSNLAMYDSISQDMMHRWTYPLVPDQAIGDMQTYLYSRHNVYRPSNGLQLSRSCVIEQNAVIGRGTKVGDNTEIKNSVIGRNCNIDSNVKLNGVYVWDDVTIGRNCELSTCLLASMVVIKPGVTIRPGCILSSGVTVGPDITLKENTLLQAKPVQDEFEQAGDAVEECNKELVGEEGHGYPFAANVESDEDEADDLCDPWGRERASSSEEESQTEDSEDENESEGASPLPDDTKLFYNEVVESLQRGMEENVKCDNLILEINSSRYAYNITMKAVVAIVARVVVELPLISTMGLSMADYPSQAKKCLGHFIPLLRNYVKDTESQLDCLAGIEECFTLHEEHSSSIKMVLHALYDKDILLEEAIVRWYQAAPVTQQGSVREAAAKFVEWLQEAEEESD